MIFFEKREKTAVKLIANNRNDDDDDDKKDSHPLSHSPHIISSSSSSSLNHTHTHIKLTPEHSSILSLNLLLILGLTKA